MQLMRVKTEDVYPSEGNPRRDFGDLDALAASFELNPAHPGEPMTPPLLVRDGGTFLIVDGERRWRAMRKRGTREFDAVVCEDWGDADAALAMLATDDKKPLDEAERSRGAQRCLLLGVEPEKVERAVRKRGMGRVKRVAEKLGAEAETMSLDHLLAVSEFEGERAERVAAASEKDWKRVAQECRREDEADGLRAGFERAAERLGIELLKEGETRNGIYAYVQACNNVKELETAVAVAPAGAAWALSRTERPYVARYDPVDTEAEAAHAALAEEADRLAAACRAMRESAWAHLAERLMAGAYPERCMAAAVSNALGDPESDWSGYARTSEALDGAGYDGERPDGRATGMLGACALRGWLDGAQPDDGAWLCVAAGPGNRPQWALDQVDAWMEAVEAAVADGWRFGAGQMQLYAKAEAWLEAARKNEEEK